MDTCACGRVIEQPARGRRRQKCLICSPRDPRDRRVASITVLPPRDPDSPDSVAAAARAALAAVGQELSWEGLAAVRLAELVDTGKHGLDKNVRELRASMEYAMLHAPEREADVIELIFADE